MIFLLLALLVLLFDITYRKRKNIRSVAASLGKWKAAHPDEWNELPELLKPENIFLQPPVIRGERIDAYLITRRNGDVTSLSLSDGRCQRFPERKFRRLAGKLENSGIFYTYFLMDTVYCKIDGPGQDTILRINFLNLKIYSWI